MDIDEFITTGFKPETKGVFSHIKGIGRNELALMFARLGFKRGVEVGTEGGKYANVLLKSIPELHLTCIDPWTVYDDGGGYKDVDQERYNKYYAEAVERTKGYNCDLVRGYSMNVIKDWPDESIDFVYIDGNHRLDYVTNDIVNWTDKVKKGGIVAGHDFIKLRDPHNSHVPYAVEAYAQAYFIKPVYILDNKNASRSVELNKYYDRIRSCFFVKK